MNDGRKRPELFRNDEKKKKWKNMSNSSEKPANLSLSIHTQTMYNMDAKETLTCELSQRPHQTPNNEAKV